MYAMLIYHLEKTHEKIILFIITFICKTLKKYLTFLSTCTYVGIPCVTLVVNNSINTYGVEKVFEDNHYVVCKEGYVTPRGQADFVAICLHTALWNTNICVSEW